MGLSKNIVMPQALVYQQMSNVHMIIIHTDYRESHTHTTLCFMSERRSNMLTHVGFEVCREDDIVPCGVCSYES